MSLEGNFEALRISKLIFANPDNYDGAEHTVDDFFRLNVVALEQLVRDPRTQVTGITVVVDLGGFGMQHAPFLSPYYVKNTTEVVQVPQGHTACQKCYCI